MTEEQYQRWSFDRAQRAPAVIEKARALMEADNPDPIAVWAIDGCLRSVLVDISPFWMRWSYFLKLQGIEKNTAVCEDPGIWCDFPEQAQTLRDFLHQGNNLVREMHHDARIYADALEGVERDFKTSDAIAWWAGRWGAFLRKYTQEPWEDREKS